MRCVGENVYCLSQFGFVNFYLLVGKSGLIVVDTGLGKGILKLLTQGLSTLGYNLSHIQHILITHGHFDHIGGLPYLQAATAAQVYAHPLEAPILRGEAQPIWAKSSDLQGISRLVRHILIDVKVTPVRVDREIQAGDQLDDLFPTMQVIGLPGHSQGQIGFWLPDQRILIGGDTMQHRLGRLKLPMRAASPDWEAAKRSVRKAADLQPLIICPGHGTPAMLDVDRLLREFLAKLPRL